MSDVPTGPASNDGLIILPTNTLLKWTVVITSSALLVLAAVLVQMLQGGGSIPVLSILFFACLVSALGLLRSTVWARVSSTVLLWIVILWLLARFSPTFVNQYVAHGQAPPTVLFLVVTTVFVGVPCLAAIVIFGKHRHEFRRKWF